MIPDGAHHVRDGLYFKRCADGSVYVEKRAGSGPEAECVFRMSIDPLEWCSVVTAVSKHGDDSASFEAARNLHGVP